MNKIVEGMTAPLPGIEHRTPQEVFDIMCRRIEVGAHYLNGPVIEPVWVVYSVIDERGMRGGLVGFFRSEPEARHGAKGKGFYGNGQVVESQALVWAGKYYWLQATEPIVFRADFDAMREAALAKLTDEDKRVLGLEGK